jgi:hypothetical protein
VNGTIFGQILTGTDVEDAVTDHLKLWSATYLAEMERQSGREPQSLPHVRSWNVVPTEPEKWPENQLPAVLVISPGLIGEPQEQGDGVTVATWSLSLSAITSARSEKGTRQLAHLYVAHLRAIMLQHPGISGFAQDTLWMGEAYDTVPQELRRTLAGATGAFAVEVSDVINRYGGPTEPADQPYDDQSDWPTVEETVVTAEKS